MSADGMVNEIEGSLICSFEIFTLTVYYVFSFIGDYSIGVSSLTAKVLFKTVHTYIRPDIVYNKPWKSKIRFTLHFIITLDIFYMTFMICFYFLQMVVYQLTYFAFPNI